MAEPHKNPEAEREKYVLAFNETMVRIWQEQITLLDVIDTGRLLKSVKALPVRADGRFIEIGLSQAFLEYGLWQDYGTGNPQRKLRRYWTHQEAYCQEVVLKEVLFLCPQSARLPRRKYRTGFHRTCRQVA